MVRSRTSWTRCRSSARSWRTAGGAIHASGSRSARSSCAKVAASTLSFFSRAEAIALHRSGCTRCGANPQTSSSSTSHPQPNPASNAAGVPGGSPPITLRIVSAPFGTFRFVSTWPSPSMTVIWERLR
jgi:hypothetical protein